MKYLLFLLITFPSFAGEDTVNNTKTDKYVAIAKTRISMLAPAGAFKTAPDGSGFVLNDTTQIQVVELPIPWQMMGAEFKDEAKNSPQTSRVFKLNGRECTLVSSKSRSARGDKLHMRTLAFGDDAGTYTVTAIFPENKADKFAKIMETALLSVVVEDKPHPPKKGAPKSMIPTPGGH